MDAGSFRYKIALNIASFTQDTDYGGVKAAYSITNVWAHIKEVAADEKLTDGIFSSRTKAIFTLRYDSTVNAVSSRDSITYDNSTYEIKSVIKKGLGNKSLIEITAIASE
jgi:head-tail adaptor